MFWIETIIVFWNINNIHNTTDLCFEGTNGWLLMCEHGIIVHTGYVKKTEAG